MDAKILSVKNLAEAKKEIKKIGVHPMGIKIMSLKAIHRLIKFHNVDPKTANIVKQEMLSRGGDAVVSRDVANFKAKTTDLIIIGTLAQYIRLIKKLKIQPYDCKKIAKKIETLLLKEGVNPNEAVVW